MGRKGVGLGPRPGRKSARGGWSRAGWGQASARLSAKWTRRAALRERLTTGPGSRRRCPPDASLSCPAAPSGGPLGRGTQGKIRAGLHQIAPKHPAIYQSQGSKQRQLGFFLGVAHATDPGLNSQHFYLGVIHNKNEFIWLDNYCSKILLWQNIHNLIYPFNKC